MHFLQPHYLRELASPYAQVYDIKIEMDRGPRFEAVVCPACGCDRRGFFSPPAQLILKKGLLPDMLYFIDLYVSEKFRAAWEASGLTGIEAFAPVETVRMLGRKAPLDARYYLVVPAVSNVRVDILASGCVSSSAVIRDPAAYRAEMLQRCVVCESCGGVRLRMHSGRLWNPAWSYPERWVFRGDADCDFFTAENAFNNAGASWILSDRFLEFVKANRLTNVFALTEQELFRAQETPNAPMSFAPVYSDPAAADMPLPGPKRAWRETCCAELACDSGRLILRDVLDDGEAFAAEIRARAGSWKVQLVAADVPFAGARHVLIRHAQSAAEATVRIGTLSLDSGAFYLRAGGRDARAESRIRDRLMEMGQPALLEEAGELAVSSRRGVPAVFLRTQAGDGDYAVFADSAEEAGVIRLGPL